MICLFISWISSYNHTCSIIHKILLLKYIYCVCFTRISIISTHLYVFFWTSTILIIEFDNITHSFFVNGLLILSAKFTKRASDETSFTLPSCHSIVIRILLPHWRIISSVLFATDVNQLSSTSSHISFNQPSHPSHL